MADSSTSSTGSDLPTVKYPFVRKANIRARLLATRRDAPSDAAARVQAALLAALGPGGEPRKRRSSRFTLTAYVPFGVEPGGSDLPAVVATAMGPGGRLLLPVLLEDLDLDWAVYDGTLVPGRRGLAEPAGPRLGRAAVTEASLVVVPAVAVDRRGVRLGRGGGSFDRALARVPPGTTVVALLHDGELLDESLPAEPHDRRVSAVITPALGLVALPEPD